jgi:hypothetical protein
VLITDILDTFGNLVYDRLKKKGAVDAGGAAISLPDDFLPSDVSADAKETCRNWYVPCFYLRYRLLSVFSFSFSAPFSFPFSPGFTRQHAFENCYHVCTLKSR